MSVLLMMKFYLLLQNVIQNRAVTVSTESVLEMENLQLFTNTPEPAFAFE